MSSASVLAAHEPPGGPTHAERGKASQQHLVTDGWHRQS